MNFLKELFINLETLIVNFFFIDFKLTLFYIFLLTFLYILHIFILRKKMKKDMNGYTEFKKLNIETSYQARKKDLLMIYLTILSLLIFTTIFQKNMNIFLPVITGIIIILIFSLKEQLNNIFLGLLFKSSFGTTIHEGMYFYFKDKPNEFYKIVKINILKCIIKNEKKGYLESIEHKDLNSLNLIHKPMKSLDYISFKYIIGNKIDLLRYKEQVQKVFNSYEQEIEYGEIKKEVISIKERFKVAPYLRPSFEIDVLYKSKLEIEITVLFTVYHYDFDKYLEDFILLKPKV